MADQSPHWHEVEEQVARLNQQIQAEQDNLIAQVEALNRLLEMREKELAALRAAKGA